MEDAAQKAPLPNEKKETKKTEEKVYETPVAVKVESVVSTPKAKLTLTDLRYERSLGSARKAAETMDSSLESASCANAINEGAEAWSVLSALDRAKINEGRAPIDTNVVHIWDNEAKNIIRPELKTLLPEQVLRFLQKYVNYAERRQILAQDTQIPFTPATIKQCMSVPILQYLIATKLPEEYKGMSAAEVPAVVVHDYIVAVIDHERNLQRKWAMFLLGKLKINMSTGIARQSVEVVFVRIWEIMKQYSVRFKHKHIIEMLMRHLYPPSVRDEIREMFKAGDEQQQEARKNLVAFHNLLEEMAKTNEKMASTIIVRPLTEAIVPSSECVIPILAS